MLLGYLNDFYNYFENFANAVGRVTDWDSNVDLIPFTKYVYFVRRFLDVIKYHYISVCLISIKYAIYFLPDCHSV